MQIYFVVFDAILKMLFFCPTFFELRHFVYPISQLSRPPSVHVRHEVRRLSNEIRGQFRFSYKHLFSSYVLALNELSNEKFAHLTLIKLTVGVHFINVL